MLQIHFLSIHIQIFRSIDSNSVKGFPKDPKEATMKVRKMFKRDVMEGNVFQSNFFFLAELGLRKKCTYRHEYSHSICESHSCCATFCLH